MTSVLGQTFAVEQGFKGNPNLSMGLGSHIHFDKLRANTGFDGDWKYDFTIRVITWMQIQIINLKLNAKFRPCAVAA